MKHCLYTFMLCLLFCTSCSWMTNFVLVNKTSETIHISYKLRKLPNGKPIDLKEVGMPEVRGSSSQEWQVLKEGEFTYDPQQRTVSMSLLPGQSILLTRDVNYTGHQNVKENELKFFELESLTIRAGKSIVHYQERELLLQFKEKNKTLYLFEYS